MTAMKVPGELGPAFAIIVTWALVACGGDSNGQGARGSVTISLTDGPLSTFDDINLTVRRIELIGNGAGPVSLFSGVRTVNLLALQNHADLFGMAEIPTGTYRKIRLHVSGLQLVRRDATGAVTMLIEPALPANGRIDLIPRADLEVSARDALVLQIDIDARKSVQIVGQGNDAYRFRPVVFMDAVAGVGTGKFTRVRGTVSGISPESLQLCNGDFELHKITNGIEQARDGRDCINVRANQKTAVFTAEGPAAFSDIMNGDLAGVIGLLRTDDLGNGGVILDAQVVGLGLDGAFTRLKGTATGAYDVARGVFILDVERGGDVRPGTRISVELPAGAKVLSRSGLVLDPSEIQAGMKISLEGVMNADAATVQASAVFVHVDEGTSETFSGAVGDVRPVAGSFALFGGTHSDLCVQTESNTDIYEIALLADHHASREIGFAQFDRGPAR